MKELKGNPHHFVYKSGKTVCYICNKEMETLFNHEKKEWKLCKKATTQ
jgi:hypothetical protein